MQGAFAHDGSATTTTYTIGSTPGLEIRPAAVVESVDADEPQDLPQPPPASHLVSHLQG
jgi:hypothetical protein